MRALVEIIDVYKTLCDIMGVPLPNDDIPVDGVSLKPLLADPTRVTYYEKKVGKLDGRVIMTTSYPTTILP